MIKKWLKIPNDIVQWTKKWHFFHFLAWGAVVPTFYLLIFFLYSPFDALISVTNYEIEINNLPAYFFEEFRDVICFYCFYALVAPWIAMFLSIIVVLIKLIFRKKLTISNKFLINNQWYNIYYITSLMGIIISCILEYIFEYILEIPLADSILTSL